MYLKIVKKGFFKVDVCVKGGSCRVQAGNSKSGRAQVLLKLAWVKWAVGVLVCNIAVSGGI